MAMVPYLQKYVKKVLETIVRLRTPVYSTRKKPVLKSLLNVPFIKASEDDSKENEDALE